MRYIAFWELDMEDMAEVVEKMKTRKKQLKTLLPPHGIGGQTWGFTVFLGEKNLLFFWTA